MWKGLKCIVSIVSRRDLRGEVVIHVEIRGFLQPLKVGGN